MTAEIVLALVLSGSIGVCLGVLGGGGSILAIPVLVYVAGVTPKSAVAMSLAMVGATSLMAGALYLRSRDVDLRVAAMFGGTGATGAMLGARLTHLLTDRALLLTFAMLMLVVGGFMLTGLARRIAERPAVCGTWRCFSITLMSGLSVGVLTGFLGVGGGFLIVPALMLLSRLPSKQAVGTSLVVIGVTSAAGFLSHVKDAPIPVPMTAAFTALAVIGALVGYRLSRTFVSPERLRRVFAGFVMAIGCLIAAKILITGS